jgi:EAL domain-containing protein (putative c-di-GMP-specific phosphodiesterase class I)
VRCILNKLNFARFQGKEQRLIGSIGRLRPNGVNMNATAFGGRPQEVKLPEDLLYDAAERLGRIREGRMALHIHLSRLLPQNRDDAKIRIAFRMFESQVDLYRGQMFLLTNSDIVLICKDARLADLDAIVYKMRALFAKDPLTYSDADEADDRFASFYDVEMEYDDFFALCGELVADAKKRQVDQRAATQIFDLDAGRLAAVIDRIAAVDISSVVRRQPCVRITDQNRAEVAFQEFYMSIADLQKALAPDVNLLANRWLFQHLSQVLDLRVLQILQEAGFRKLPAAFSVNLNVASVDTPVFQKFMVAMRGRAGVQVEFQLTDIFNNLDAFFHARDMVRAHGVTTVLDGISSLTLQFMDVELYDTDFVKITWSPDMANEAVTAEMVTALAPVGFERVILARCDTEASIAWGLRQGITQFQGRYLDSMLAAVTMGKCNKAPNCTLQQCIQRHGVISGRPRAECGNNDMLDTFPPLVATPPLAIR